VIARFRWLTRAAPEQDERSRARATQMWIAPPLSFPQPTLDEHMLTHLGPAVGAVQAQRGVSLGVVEAGDIEDQGLAARGGAVKCL
jgi:hypothetical protein